MADEEPMRIIVPIKQVPETGNVKMDEETGTIIREGSERIINPLDLYALEKAIQVKEEYGGTVTAISMGPPAAAEALREAVAMGCDEATLITDRAFAGSDTWATSIILSEAIRHLGEYDLIIAGERATDGDTGQVGPNLAAALELPLATFIRSLEILPRESDNERNSEGGKEAAGEAAGKLAGIRVERLIEEGYEGIGTPAPRSCNGGERNHLSQASHTSGKAAGQDFGNSPTKRGCPQCGRDKNRAKGLSHQGGKNHQAQGNKDWKIGRGKGRDLPQ